ncbi:leucyl aminopeptidase [Sinirhodobacter populi]|uniref:Probable cytosol aminopeptidase n=1 Tax=Paenirhodobacter populi TaxID=2306993 RepID=A0A443K571_9RHOB|nr:leucyl aminopeptidase [Sinirhodobacter populi]RWR27927.1 leucyl aminopeptidase [Sinirhodobacter populi]
MSVAVTKAGPGPETPISQARVVVVLSYGTESFGPKAAALDLQTGGAISRAVEAARFTGAEGACLDVLAPQGLGCARVVVLGMGAEARTSLGATRSGAALARHLEAAAEPSAMLIFDTAKGEDGAETLARLLLGVRLRNYRFALMPASEKPFALALEVISDVEASSARVDAVAEGVALARDLVNYPASHLNPDNFPDFLEPLRRAGIEIEVLDADDLSRLGMNAVLAVGAGSARQPKVIVMRYRGEDSPAAPLALVGKGMCFDAGGLCIKSGPQMFGMKADMGGAAAVIGTMLALARQKRAEHVVGVIGVAENMLSGASYKPGDIVTTLSGKTVEVYDTDCEGRMVLADILYFAASRYQPRAIVDLATLTYSVMRGLGHVFAGLFATHDDLAAGLLAAGEKVGERFWRMPLDPAYDAGLYSPVADLRQHARDLEDGDAPHAAAFLRNFTEGRPWVHLDIAGKELIDEDRPMARSGGSGFGVQLLEEWITSQADELKRL